jgi:4-amino-4-deoxy-L-arabinose transferase-like glycosyltransferase
MAQAFEFDAAAVRPLVGERSGGLSPWALAVLLIGCLLPFAAGFVTFHPDERHYTDASARMVASGDYLTPHTPNGTLRFNKPVGTYWLIVPWQHALGATPLAGRLSFVLFSAAIVLLVYYLAWLVYEDRLAALWSAAIMATHIPLLAIAASSIPEVPLTFCWVLCGGSLAAIVALGRREPIFYWAAYGGAGLGVAVKGMPILVLVAYAWAFALWNPWRRTPLRELLHLPSMAAGAIVGGWWYVAMFALHGEVSLAMFMSDQVTDRVGHSPLRLAKNLLLVAVWNLLAFLPWNLPLVGRALQRRTRLLARPAVPSSDHQAMFVRFAIGWAIVMGVVIALVDRFAMRYLLATTPLLAIVLAGQLRKFDPALLARHTRRVQITLALLAFVLLGLMLLVHRQMETPLAATLAGVVVGVAAVGMLTRQLRPLADDATRAALATLLLLPLGYLVLQPIALPDSGTLFAEQVRRLGLTDQPDLAYAGHPALVSKARVAAGGKLDLFVLDDPEDLTLPEYSRVLLRSDDLDVLPRYRHAGPSEYYEVETEFTAGPQSLPAGPLLLALVRGELKGFLDSRSQRFVVLRRKD